MKIIDNRTLEQKSFIEYINDKSLYYLVKYGRFDKEININYNNDVKPSLYLDEYGKWYIKFKYGYNKIDYSYHLLEKILEAIKHDSELVNKL